VQFVSLSRSALASIAVSCMLVVSARAASEEPATPTPEVAAVGAIQPMPLTRIGGPALAMQSKLWRSEYQLMTGQQFPTFQQVPLPPVPQGSGWTWTYRYSFWDSKGCLQDVVSYGGATYHLVACCPPPSMSFPCPEQ